MNDESRRFQDTLIAIDHFGQDNSAAGIIDRVESTADIGDWVTQGMRARLILDGIARIKYRGDKGKLAAWFSASHIEKAPEKKKDDPPTPPTPYEVLGIIN